MRLLLPLLVLPLLLARPAAGVAKWSHIKDFFDKDNQNLNFFAPALRKEHLNPNTKEKMRVKLAAQVFSHSVAAGMYAKISEAGICWTGMERGGKCTSVSALHTTRAECCAGAPAAWSPQDLDAGKIFFYKALSGGVPCSACQESCAGVSCGAGKRCVVRNGRARCVCASSCRRAGPVCGSDGKTYRSLCRLRRRACRRPMKHLSLDYPGPCRVGTCEGVRCGGDKRCVLDQELGAHCIRCQTCNVAGAPVCAVDGRSYAGTCALRRAACERGKALPMAYRGACIANATCSMIRCPTGHRCAVGGASGVRCVSCGTCTVSSRRSLCGSDGKTYAGWCRMQRAACRSGLLVEAVRQGPCLHGSKNSTNYNVSVERKRKD